MTIANTVYLAAAYHFARMRGLWVERISLGIGPALFSRGILVFRLFPLGGFVRVYDRREDADWERDAKVHLAVSFDCQPRWVRVCFMATGCAALVLLATALHGVDGWLSFTHGFAQLFAGALDPRGRGAEMIRGLCALATEGNYRVFLAVISAKFAAFNALPVPPLSGFGALYEAVRSVPESDRNRALWQNASIAGLCVLLALLAAWIWAIYSAVTSAANP